MTRKIKPKGNTNATVLIVGDFPTLDCLKYGEPFAGYAGGHLDDWLSAIGLRRSDCRVMYACMERPPKGEILSWVSRKQLEPGEGYVLRNGLYISPEIQEGIELLEEEIRHTKPNLIVTMGNLPLWLLTGNWGAINWRGSLIKNDIADWPCKVIPTVSIADVNSNPEWKPIVKSDFGRVKKEHSHSEFPERIERFIIRPTLRQVIETLKMLEAKHNDDPENFFVACDIETRGADISCIGFGWSRQDAICIPLMDVTKPEGYWTVQEEVLIYIAVTSFLKKVKQVGQNFKYDMEFFRYKLYVDPKWERDTMISHHSMLPTGKIDLKDVSPNKQKGPSQAEKKGLGFLSSIYCKDHVYWKEERETWEDESEYWIYNCRDCVRTWEIDVVQQSLKKKKHPKQEAVTDFQNKLIGPVWRIMKRGMRVDLARKAEFETQLKNAALARENWLAEVLGHKLNISSSNQMKELFYSDLGCKEIKKRSQTGGMVVTCDDAALEKIATDDPLLKPIIEVIQELRSINRFLGTFLEAKLHEDGRFRFAINIAGTKTFRFSSTKTAFGYGTNSENIPANQVKRNDEIPLLPDIRTIYIPDEGKVIADTDLDSADLRIVVAESGCTEMLEWFNAGLKPYVEIAKEYYRDNTITKNHWAYKLFKSLCHGTNYLGEASGLSTRCGLLVHEVERIQKWYFGKFPGIEAWQNEIKRQIQGRRFVENAFGYRAHFLGRISESTFREGVAWIPQTTVANVIDRALVNIDNNLPDVDLLNQVHDSLVMQFPDTDVDGTLKLIHNEMQIIVPYPEPLIIPVGVKTSSVSWGNCD